MAPGGCLLLPRSLPDDSKLNELVSAVADSQREAVQRVEAAERAGNAGSARKAYERALNATLTPKLKTYVKSRLTVLTDSTGPTKP